MSTFGFGCILDSGLALPNIAGIHSYYSADKTTNASGFATAIQDISGQNEQSLVTVSGNPIYNQADSNFNNKPSLSCVSAARRVEATFNNALAQPYTCYLVMRVETNANTVYWRTNQGNFTDSAGFYLQSDLIPRMQVLDGGNAITSSNALSSGTNYVCCAVYNGNSSAIYFNNSTTANASSPSQGSLDANGCVTMTVGTFTGQNASYTWTTMINYSGAHDQATRFRVMKFLGSKYAISVT